MHRPLSAFTSDNPIRLVFFLLLSLSSIQSALSADAPPTGDTITLGSISIGPLNQIGNVSDIVDAENTYDAMPQRIKDVIGLRFFVVDRKSGKIVTGSSLEKISIELDQGQDEDSLAITVNRDGHVDLPSLTGAQHAHARIFANVPKSQYDIKHRLFIRLPRDTPLTLEYMKKAAEIFIEAYKPYAGIVFRTFIGNRKPNCFGMNFLDPQTVSVLTPFSSSPNWVSKKDTRVVIFFEDITTDDPNAYIIWSGSEPPFLTAACLQKKEGSR